MGYSANLGFLFTELELPDRIRAAKAMGFEAVECHFPYDTPAGEVEEALAETGLKMLGLNTVPGNVAAGDFGLAALPGREAEARAAIEQAVVYGAAIGAANVHVMAGKTDGSTEAEVTFRANLAFASDLAASQGMNVLIEPINHRDVPGYHISRVEHAAEIIAALERGNLRLMFDCYHSQIMQGDLITRIRDHLQLIGHIQIAAVPSRAEPDEGEVDYTWLVREIRDLGYSAPIGAEYKPRSGRTSDGLAWLAALPG